MSGTWNDPTFQQNAPGGIKLFDPTQFQAPMSAPASAAPPAQSTYSQPSQNSWNSWGSWDWNSDNTVASAGGVQQHQPTAQGAFAGDGSGAALPAAFSSSGGVGDQQQIYQGHNSHVPQYSQAWNQGWDGANLQQQQQQQQQYDSQQQQQQYDPQQQQQQQQQYDSQQQQQQQYDPQQQQQQYDHQQHQQQQYDPQQHQQQQYDPQQQQYPAYDQPDAVGGPNNLQQYQQSNEEIVNPSQYGSHQFYGGQYYNQQPQQYYQQQQQQYSEESALSSHPGSEPSVQQQHREDQAYQQGTSVDQGQHQFPHHQGYYDQPYEASTWTATTGSEGHFEMTSPQLSGEQHQATAHNDIGLSSSAEEQAEQAMSLPNESVPLERSEILPPHHKEPVLDAFDDNDNDGTVSGFFGRDDDGDIPSESPRLDRSTGADFRHQLPVAQSSFHRTHSDISNASLTTLNFPHGDGDEDDGDPLHHVQELVQRMEETHLARIASERRSRSPSSAQQEPEMPHHQGISADRNVGDIPPGGFPAVSLLNDASLSDSGDQAQQLHAHGRGDYSGFGGGAPDFSAPNKPDPPNLPLNTDLRPASPDGDDHPGSGGSGASGGSSGLADWEIVPSQASSGPSHSGNSSLDNGVSGGGGGFFTDKPDGGIASSNNNSMAPTATSDSSVTASGDNCQPVPPPTSNTETGSHQTAHQQTMMGQGDVKSETDLKGIALFKVPQQPPPSTVTTTPSTNLSLPPSVPPQGGDSLANPFRRDGNKSPRHASLAQPSSSVSTLPPSSALSQQPDKVQGLSALPSRPKPPQAPSTEDGIPARRHEQKPAHDSAASQDQRRHHSAFHPVSRPRHTTMSPATTLWDQGDTSSSNILLAPAAPLIIPALNPYSSSAAASSSKDSEPQKHAGATSAETPQSRDKSFSGSKQDSKKGVADQREEDPNRSLDSLDELDDVPRSARDRSYKEQRDREERYRRDREADRDRPSSRVDRPHSRTGGQYHYDRDRPSSRAEGYARDDPYRRRAYYRDYGDLSYDERYDRPRSRQDESRGSRPTSRTGQQEVDRPRSRANYDRDREYYGRGDRHRGYGYDPYGRHADYAYDERERYYRYYREKEARYARGYYEEYYGAKQAEQYLQQQHQQHRQQQQQQQRPGSQAADRSDNQSRQSRGATPAMAGSRGNTPGVGAPSPGPDYYGRHGSRPPSRADYNRDYYYNKGYDYSGYYYDGYGYDPYAYGYGYPGYDDSYNQSYDQGRMTPPKYSYPHTRACFGPGGQLVKVLPNQPADGQPALVELQDVQTLLQACPEAEELRQFPGPLTRANTHKKDVLLFCQQKAKECAENVSMTDRESAQLIWRLLELLIKQNGSVVGTDLSDLLLEGHEPSTHEYALHGLRIAQSQSPVIAGSAEEDRSSSRGGESPALRVSQDRSVISQATAGGALAEREAWIDRFRHLLLYGRKKDALECAMKNNLWGHALFLASKMDSRTHANVMTRFANSAMRMNDPLQTLYQLMSNRQPAAVTCVSDERWGDWRPHLAMMLSNQTSRSDVDRKSICTLGDTLASKGCLHASHFCYLMAQVTLGTYYKKTSKIVLIGASHTLPMAEFATMNAIQCTEVYEYAQLLGNPAFCLPHFQIYKYLYACRLADYGMAPEALYYCEVIANIIQQCPAWFKPSFVKLVYQLSSKLKFSDPQRLHTSVDAQDPVWIQQLSQISAAFEDGSLQPVSGSATPANVMGGTTTSSESGDYSAGYYGNNGYNGYGQSAELVANMSTSGAGGAEAYPGQQHVDAGSYYSGEQQAGADAVDQLETIPEGQQQQQQQSDANQGQIDYTQQQQQQHWNNYGQWQPDQQAVTRPTFSGSVGLPVPGTSHDDYDSDGYAASHYSQHPQHHHHHYHHQQHHHHHGHQQHQQPQGENQNQEYDSQQQQQQQHHYHYSQQHNMGGGGGGGGDVHSEEPPSPQGSSELASEDVEDRSSIGGGSQYDASSASSTLYGQGLGGQQQQQQQNEYAQQQQQYQHPHHQFQHFPQGGLPPRAGVTTNETTEDEANVYGDEDDDEEDEVDATASGFDYFGNVGQVQKVVAPPHRYRSQSGSSSTGGRRRRTTSGSSTGSVKAAPNRGGGQGAAPAGQHGGGLGAGGDKKPGQQGSGWFGGLFSKFGRKGKNEMILPDDKDPAIVWDPVKEKWVNSDGTEEESHSAAPPPKDADLMGKPPGGPPPANSVGPGDGAPPPPPAAAAATANRFSLKAKGARNQYVDVNNPKPVAVPSSLFNVMSTPGADGSAAPPQVYMPGSAPTPDGNNITNSNNNNNNTSSNTSQGLLSVPDNSDQLSRTSSMSSLSHEVHDFMQKTPAAGESTATTAAAPQVPQMPMLFNPASLKAGSGSGHPQQTSAGPGLKYGQRRAYPK